MPDELRVQALVWRLRAGPLAGALFVGGYFGGGVAGALVRGGNGAFAFRRDDFFRLDGADVTFFGVEKTIFQGVVDGARSPADGFARLETFQRVSPFYSGISILRDGSVLGPLDFFEPVDIVSL